MTKRRTLSVHHKRTIRDAQQNCCAMCGESFGYHGKSKVEYDHIIPLALGGSNDLENFQALCRECHVTEKTKLEDMPRIRKARRCAAKLTVGHPRPQKKWSRKIESRGFDQRFKRKLNGETVEND